MTPFQYARAVDAADAMRQSLALNISAGAPI
jgi:hypothetical protein